MKKIAHIGQSVVAALLIGVANGAGAAPAHAVIEHLDGALIATMKQADSLGFAGRYKKLAPVIDKSFALPTIAKLALGAQWHKLSAGQQKRYRAMFRKDTVATYAQRFDGYSGQHFKITGVKPAPGGRKEVDTVILSKSADPIPINYTLEKNHGRWQVINVVAKGVSNLALKRGQYTGVIRDKGPAAFIQQFQDQLKKYPPLPNG